MEVSIEGGFVKMEVVILQRDSNRMNKGSLILYSYLASSDKRHTDLLHDYRNICIVDVGYEPSIERLIHKSQCKDLGNDYLGKLDLKDNPDR